MLTVAAFFVLLALLCGFNAIVWARRSGKPPRLILAASLAACVGPYILLTFLLFTADPSDKRMFGMDMVWGVAGMATTIWSVSLIACSFLGFAVGRSRQQG